MTAWRPECANPVSGPDDDLDCWYCEHCEHWITDDDIIEDEQVEALDQAVERMIATIAPPPNQFIATDEIVGGSAEYSTNSIPIALVVEMFNESEPQPNGWALTQRSIKTSAPYPVRDIGLIRTEGGRLADIEDYMYFTKGDTLP